MMFKMFVLLFDF